MYTRDFYYYFIYLNNYYFFFFGGGGGGGIESWQAGFFAGQVAILLLDLWERGFLFFFFFLFANPWFLKQNTSHERVKTSQI